MPAGEHGATGTRGTRFGVAPWTTGKAAGGGAGRTRDGDGAAGRRRVNGSVRTDAPAAFWAAGEAVITARAVAP